MRNTNGAIVAGEIPSRPSVKAKTVPSSATATSAAATSPTPPPMAAPATRATTGFRQPSTAANIAAKFLASSLFSS